MPISSNRYIYIYICIYIYTFFLFRKVHTSGSQPRPATSPRWLSPLRLRRPQRSQRRPGSRGSDARKQWSDEEKAMVLADLAEMKASKVVNARAKCAAKHRTSIGNISRWTKEQEKIMASAGRTVASKLLSINSRKMLNSVRGQCRQKFRMQQDENQELARLRRHVLDRIRIRRLDRKPVHLKFVARVTKARIRELQALGINICIRGKPFTASTHWCWRLLGMAGFGHKKKGCKKCCSPASMAMSISRFSHFVRYIVTGKAYIAKQWNLKTQHLRFRECIFKNSGVASPWKFLKCIL